jgi:cardiolipin synthase
MLNLPNSLTLVRILTIPFFLILLAYHRYGEALLVFIFGGVTDFLDGLAARLMNQKTALGAYLDPVADKLLVITSFVMLSLIGGIPTWLAVVVISRDVLLIIGYGVVYFLVEDSLEVNPSLVGKASTMLQLFTLGAALGILHDPCLIPPLLMGSLIGATAAATVLSGVQYLYRGLVWMQNRASSISRVR